MNDYKIKVSNEAESKEAQELFFELGYGWTNELEKKVTTSQDAINEGYSSNYQIFFIYAGKDGRLLHDTNDKDAYKCYVESHTKELTLHQLRDLVVLHRNDVRDANCTYQPSGTNEVLSGYLTSDDWYYLFTGGSWQKHISTKHEAANKFKAIQKPTVEQGLISGADAKLAWAKGEIIQTATLPIFDERSCWMEITKNYELGIFDQDGNVFRIKPRTIKLELEIPAPFEPKQSDWGSIDIYYLDTAQSDGWNADHWNEYFDLDLIQFGAWRTEEEIKQVVAALRGIKG